MLIDTASIALRAPDRAQIAQQTAEWISAGKKIEQIPYGVSAATQSDADAISRKRGNVAGSKAGKAKGEETLRKITKAAASGMTIAEIAEHAGVSRDTAMRLMEKHGIERGPRMRLEA